jgi:hypothetical protein
MSLTQFTVAELLNRLLSGEAIDGVVRGLPVELLNATVTLNAQDLEIGGVEIKNGTDDTRAVVKTDGTNNALVVTQNAQPLPTGAATQTTLAAVLAKLTSDPATQTTLAAVLAKLSSDPATQTTLAAVLAKLSSDPATQTTLAAVLAACLAATPAGENHIGAVGGHTARLSDSVTRPSDTNAYASGDLIANSTVASSVVPLSFAIGRGGLGKGGMIRRVRLRKTGTSITNAQFRLHLYSASPVQTGAGGANTGDNAAWSTDGAANYVGAFDITVDKAFTDGAAGNGAPLIGSEINFTADTYYGLLEARAAYTPANGETFSLLLEVIQN